MPAKRKATRKIKEVLRLKFEAGLSHERIAAAVGVSKGAVTKYVQRAVAAGLGWPLAPERDDAALEALLFPHSPALVAAYAPPDYALIHQELNRKGVTLQLLWEEYSAAHPGGAYRYSQFCLHYHRFRESLKRSMRQVHRAGDKLFIDYSGATVPIIAVETGEIRRAEIFVVVLGASSYVYAEATWTQQLPDWIDSHVCTFEFMGCVAALLVPDNLKSAIRKACRFEPEANSTYADMARHYGCAILPARPYKPRDKATVEQSVLLVQRWILARLRNRQFFSLAELNAAISTLLADLNQRPFKKLDGCRASMFESIDRPAMRPLPEHRYEFAEWKSATVNIDYHVDVTGHYYSVPHNLVRLKVEVRSTATTIECFFKGKRVAAHVRSNRRGYLRAPRLFDELSLCHADGSFRKRLAAIAKVDLVVIDDFAIAPIGALARTDLLELLDDRVGTRSTLFTSQLPIEHWHEYIGDPSLRHQQSKTRSELFGNGGARVRAASIHGRDLGAEPSAGAKDIPQPHG